MDHEFVIWVSLCSMVVIRWVFGFHRAQWHCCVGFTMLNGVIWVLPCSMVSLCSASVGFWVSLCWLWFDCDMSFLGFAMFCGAGLAERWVAVWWTFRDERDRDKFIYFFIFYFIIIIILQYCYSAILHVELHCSTIVKKIAILGFDIPWCWVLIFGICISQCSCSYASADNHMHKHMTSMNVIV